MRKLQRALIRSADLVVGLGYDTIEVEYEAWVGEVPVLHVDIERADVDAERARRARSGRRSRRRSIARLAALPAATNDWPRASCAAASRAVPGSAAAGDGRLRSAPGDRRRAPLLPRDGMLAFDVGAHTHQIGSQWTAHAPAHLPHHQRLVVDGLRHSGGARREARAARPAGGVHARRRLLPDDLRRGGGRAGG